MESEARRNLVVVSEDAAIFSVLIFYQVQLQYQRTPDRQMCPARGQSSSLSSQDDPTNLFPVLLSDVCAEYRILRRQPISRSAFSGY